MLRTSNSKTGILKRTSIYFFFFILFSFFFTRCFSQPSASTDTNKILIGQQFHLDLKIRFSAQHKVEFPAIGDTLTSQIEVVEKSPIDTVFDKEDITQKTLHQRLTLTSFDSGFFAIPPFFFVVNSDTLETEPLLIEVQTIQVDSSQLADIKAPLEVQYSFLDWLKDNWKLTLGIMAALAAISYLIYSLTKKKPAPVVVEKKLVPKLPAHTIALQKLEKLKEKKLWQSDKVKQYHIELSEIIREYLENRFHISAMEQTTYEILQSLRTTPLENGSSEKLRQLLTLSDLVKFAKEIPLATENEMCMSYAYEFIETTKILKAETEKPETQPISGNPMISQ